MKLIEDKIPEITLERGFSLIKKGELSKAISVMDKLINQDPYLSQAYWARALCREYCSFTDEDTEQAISDYSKSIVYAREPSPISYGRRGVLYFRLGKYEQALKDLNKALETDVFWTEARFYKGRALVALNRDKDDLTTAVRDFTDVIRSVDEPFSAAHFWRAQAHRLLDEAVSAVSDYERAIEINPDDVLALNALAYCCEYGVGLTVDRDRAETLYTRAAEQGFIVAQKNLAWFYSGGNYLEHAALSAFWMKKAAVNGDAEAQNLYGLRCLHGKGVDHDLYQAVYFFGLAAKQGCLPAICNLADCYERGIGVEKNPDRAFELYLYASKKGSEPARYNVGRHYYFGIGVDEDNGKSFEVLKPLADGGYADAQNIIGLCYENGYGTPCCLKTANKYYKMAYMKGHLNSTVYLATNMRCGAGIKKNLSAAIRLYTEAGEKGSAYAWFALGRLYFEDKYDYKNAEKMFRRAIAGGKDDISYWLAASILRGKAPQGRINEVYSLLRQSVERNENGLYAALLMRELDYYGICGWPIDAKPAVSHMKEVLPADDEPNIPGLSCAYLFMARAYELGLGVGRNSKRALEYYNKSDYAGAKGHCRCYVAGQAHRLINGVGCKKDYDSAKKLLEDEALQYGDRMDCAAALIYIWIKISEPEDSFDVERMTAQILRENPHEPSAMYFSYFMRKSTPDAGKYLNKLRKCLEAASPYYRFMIETHLASSPDKPLYPILTAGDIDKYKKQSATG